jgi:hypothetical protein
MFEVWFDVTFPLWADFYKVSNLGRVRNKRNNKILSTPVGKNGYASVTLKKKPHKWCVAVHTLILHTFNGKPPSPKHECCHNNSIRNDNRICNLRWGTRCENHSDKIKLNRTNRKFTEDQVKQIKEMIVSGENNYAIATKFGVYANTINNIRVGVSYFD